MSDDIQNAGAKGMLVLKIFIAVVLFISLWAFIYYSNYNGLPS